MKVDREVRKIRGCPQPLLIFFCGVMARTLELMYKHYFY